MSYTADKIEQICASAKQPLKHICAAIDVSYGTLHAQIRNDRAIPFATVEKIAKYFGISTDYFCAPISAIQLQLGEFSEAAHGTVLDQNSRLGIAQARLIESGLQLSTDLVLDWLNRENFVLRNHESFEEKFDLFFPVSPSSDVLVPKKLGKESLATIFFDLKDEKDYVAKISNFPRDVLNGLIDAHFAVHNKTNYQVDDIELSVDVQGTTVAGRYRRVLAPVSSEDGQKFTLVFARLIEAFQPKPRVHNETAY